jgi:hypothetical protein
LLHAWLTQQVEGTHALNMRSQDHPRPDEHDPASRSVA